MDAKELAKAKEMIEAAVDAIRVTDTPDLRNAYAAGDILQPATNIRWMTHAELREEYPPALTAADSNMHPE